MKSETNTIDRPAPLPASRHPGEDQNIGPGRNLAASSDADLLEAWRRDQHAPALAMIVERYSRMVLSVCRRRCRTEADAEDAYQSTFLYLARNCRKIRRPECLAGWLQRVAQRAAIATLKPLKRKTESMVDTPAEPDDPLDRLTQRHAAIVLDEELAELPEHYRTAIVMHLYEGRPLQALADHFGTTVGSIRGRLQRGKQILAQRLRRRGVVPIVAFAAANAWTVSKPQAVQAAEQFVGSTGDGLPEAPIDTPLLESLLSEGVRLMPSLYTAFGMIGGTALIAALMMNDAGNAQQRSLSAAPESTVTLSGEAIGPPSADVVVQNQTEAGGAEILSQAAQGGMGGFGGGVAGGSPNTGDGWINRATVPEATSPIAQEVTAKLDSVIDLRLDTKLGELGATLGDALEVPVMLDARGIAFAKQDEKSDVRFSGKKPLRTALRNALSPLGLKAIVEDEGLLITADPNVLVHQGIGTTRWINIDEDAEADIARTLDRDIQVQFIEMPLSDIVSQLRSTHELNAVIDNRALEEIGLSSEEIVSFVSASTSIRNFLDLILRDLDLVYTIDGETMIITTVEAAEARLISRIYWLEGTGFAPKDSQGIVDTLQTTVEPDTWEALGGPSTMVPLGSSRPALMINTTYKNHQSIADFFDAMREAHFGREPELQRYKIPSGESAAGGAMGGGGMF